MARFVSSDRIGTIVVASETAAAAIVTATISSEAGSRLFLTDIIVTGLGATSAVGVEATLTGTGITQKFSIGVPAGVTAQITPLVINLGRDGIPASADNVNFVLTIPSFGTGNTKVNGQLIGYKVPSAAA